jgi:hypothetical protein
MIRFLGVVNWGSIRPCVIFSLFGVVLGSSDVVTGCYVCCCEVRQQRCGLVSAIPRDAGSRDQWSTQPETIQHSTASRSQLTRQWTYQHQYSIMRVTRKQIGKIWIVTKTPIEHNNIYLSLRIGRVQLLPGRSCSLNRSLSPFLSPFIRLFLTLTQLLSLAAFVSPW